MRAFSFARLTDSSPMVIVRRESVAVEAIMTLVAGMVVMLGSVGAMDRTTGTLRRRLAWVATVSGTAVVTMLAVAPPNVWIG